MKAVAWAGVVLVLAVLAADLALLVALIIWPQLWLA
jgi:hypothetical protein